LCGAAAVCQHAAELPVALGSAGSFTALAGSTVTNTGPTIVTGNVGVSPGSAVTGFPPGTVVGGAIHAADGAAALAQGDLTAAYNDAAGRTVPTLVAGDLGGSTLAPGLYKSTSTLGITGVLTLDGGGDPNAVFIFQIASGLTTAVGSSVVLQNGAQAANIFWQVGSSATLGTGSIFKGTILAQVSVTVGTGASLTGRALARTGAVTLDSNTTFANPGPPTGSADLSITKTGPATAAPNTNITYTITVSNAGPSSATSVAVTDVLPAGLTFVSATPTQGFCSGTSTVSCALGTVTSGSSAGITLVVHTPAAPATFNNTATVTSAVPDPTPGNNSASATSTPPASVPALSTWGLGLLTLSLAGFGGLALRKTRNVQY
jgi:uncharacterized repeat protein (TIGR01451 family)